MNFINDNADEELHTIEVWKILLRIIEFHPSHQSIRWSSQNIKIITKII